MTTRHNTQTYIRHAVVVSAVIGTAAACLPGGFVFPGFDFDATEMASFRDCSTLEQNLKERALAKAQLQTAAAAQGRTYNASVGNVGANSPAPFTTTNNQEEGVDEADIFKVDADYAYAIHDGAFVIVKTLRGDTTRGITDGRVVAEVDLGGPAFDMYLTGDRAAILFHAKHREVKEHFQTDVPDRPSDADLTKVALYDITDRTAPKLLRELLVEGEYISSRRVDDRVYLVSKAMLDGPETGGTPSDAHWLSDRKSAIANASIDAWMPYYYTLDYNRLGQVDGEAKRCACESTYASPAAEGDDAIAVYSFGLDQGETSVETATIIGDGAMVYASTRGLVVALNNYAEAEFTESDSNWGDDSWDDGWDDPWGDDPSSDDSYQSTVEKPVTYLHRFELKTNGKVEYQAAGQVDGWALNQFSFSEYRGYLRVATQIDDPNYGTRETGVFVLKLDDKDSAHFKTRGAQAKFLSVVGEVRGIGFDEELYAVRFIEDVGYVVTFRQTDPLYTIDLSSPNNPVVRGELQIPGYSTYLHPMDDGHLIGIGRVTDTWDEGIKVSVFDVSNLSSPKVVDERVIGDDQTVCEAVNDHRAFRYLPDQKLMILPVSASNNDGLYVYKMSPTRGAELMGRIYHKGGAGHALRSYVVGDYIYGYSTAGITITPMSDLERTISIDL